MALTPLVHRTLLSDKQWAPSIINRDRAAAAITRMLFPGGNGMRGIIRGPGRGKADVTVTKNFKLTWEHNTMTCGA